MLRSSGLRQPDREPRRRAAPLSSRAASCHVPAMPMPTEIVGLLRSTITFAWEDEHKTVYPARELRLALPLRRSASKR